METQEGEKEVERRNVDIKKNKELMKRGNESKREQGLVLYAPDGPSSQISLATSFSLHKEPTSGSMVAKRQHHFVIS